MKRKLMVMVLLFVMLGTALFAGAQAEAEEAGSDYALTVWKFGGVRIEKAFAVKQVAAWNEQHPDMKVEWIEYDWGSRIEKVVTASEAGRLPDIIVVDTQGIPDFANMGAIQAISDLDPAIVEKWEGRIVPEVMELGYYDGDFYGFSTYVDMATFLGYNIDMVRKAGLVDAHGDATAPETWNELLDYAKKLDSSGYPAILLSATNNVCDINMLEGIAYANGGRWLAPDGSVAVNGPGFTDALKLYKALYDYALPGALESNYRDSAVQFFNKQAALYPALSWIGVFNTELQMPSDFAYRMATFPTPDRVTGKYMPVSSLMTGTFCPLITTNCENTNAALAFIDYWTEDQNLLAWNGSVQFGRVPSGIVCWETDGIDQYWPDLKKAYLAGDLFKNVQPMPAFAGLTSGQSYLAEALQKVLLDVATPQEALDEVAKKLSAEL